MLASGTLTQSNSNQMAIQSSLKRTACLSGCDEQSMPSKPHGRAGHPASKACAYVGIVTRINCLKAVQVPHEQTPSLPRSCMWPETKHDCSFLIPAANTLHHVLCKATAWRKAFGTCLICLQLQHTCCGARTDQAITIRRVFTNYRILLCSERRLQILKTQESIQNVLCQLLVRARCCSRTAEERR